MHVLAVAKYDFVPSSMRACALGQDAVLGLAESGRKNTAVVNFHRPFALR